MIHALTATMTLWGSQPKLAASIPFARRYAIKIDGAPGTALHLQSGSLPPGWVASFCTPHLCAPGQVAVVLPRSGHYKTEFQIVPDDGTRRRVQRIVVRGSAGTQTFVLERTSRPSDSVDHL